MPRIYTLRRWVRMAWTVLPDAVGALVVVGATAGGFVVGLVAHPDACVDRRPLFLALTGEGVLLIGAVAFLLVRGAQLRASGTTVLLMLGIVGVFFCGGALWTWLGLGLCFRGFTF